MTIGGTLGVYWLKCSMQGQDKIFKWGRRLSRSKFLGKLSTPAQSLSWLWVWADGSLVISSAPRWRWKNLLQQVSRYNGCVIMGFQGPEPLVSSTSCHIKISLTQFSGSLSPRCIVKIPCTTPGFISIRKPQQTADRQADRAGQRKEGGEGWKV